MKSKIDLKKFFKMKLNFFPPEKSNILIYDYVSLTNGSANILFRNLKKTIYFNRYENINLYILFKAISFPKYKELKKNYKYHYLKQVNPKIVYTSIDNNPGFFLLKDIYPNATYIADQENIRNNDFYNLCIKEKRINKTVFKCDYFFTLGKKEKKRIKKIIKTKIIVGGNTKNNNFNNIKIKKTKKIITFISSKIWRRTNLERAIFNNLIIFCKKYKYKLFFLDRRYENNKPLLKKLFKSDNWYYLQIDSFKKKFNFLKKIFNRICPLHFRIPIIIKGARVVAFNHNLLNPDDKIAGPFWCKPYNYKIFEKKLLKVISYNQREWKKISDKYSKDILVYDKKNLKKRIVIDKILNK